MDRGCSARPYRGKDSERHGKVGQTKARCLGYYILTVGIAMVGTLRTLLRVGGALSVVPNDVGAGNPIRSTKVVEEKLGPHPFVDEQP